MVQAPVMVPLLLLLLLDFLLHQGAVDMEENQVLRRDGRDLQVVDKEKHTGDLVQDVGHMEIQSGNPLVQVAEVTEVLEEAAGKFQSSNALLYRSNSAKMCQDRCAGQ